MLPVHMVIAGATALAAMRLTGASPVAFSSGQKLGVVAQLTEASGLAMSRLHKDVLYVHDDDGGAYLYAINATNGLVIAKIKVKGATNNDWEDVAVGPCGSDSCIFIADTGDKNSNSAANVIYRIKENPSLSTLSVDAEASFDWEYEDAETLMVEPDGDVWLIPKVKKDPKLFKIKASYFGGKKVNLTGTGSDVNIDLGGKLGPTAGDISPDGTGVLLRTKDGVWYYQLPKGETSIRLTMSRPPIRLPVENEPQGEAVCWNQSGNGYFTLSEGLLQPLYFYRRTVPAIDATH